jgi:choline-glycine betaine transporter
VYRRITPVTVSNQLSPTFGLAGAVSDVVDLAALLAGTKASATAVPRFTPLAVIEVVVTLPNTKLSVLLIASGCIFNIGI